MAIDVVAIVYVIVGMLLDLSRYVVVAGIPFIEFFLSSPS